MNQIPSFIPVQETFHILPNGNSVSWALRMVRQPTGHLMSLEYVEEEVPMKDRGAETLVDVAVKELLAHGTKFEEAKASSNIIRASNEIARNSRRGGGNQLIVHKRDAAAFRDLMQPLIAARYNFWIHEVETPALRGNVIMTYKSDKNEVDGGMILVYADGGEKYGYTTNYIQPYTCVLPFGCARLEGLEGRRARKAYWSKQSTT